MVSRRLERWIRSAYPGISADAILRELARLRGRAAELGTQGSERIEAALVFIGDGDVVRFRDAIDLLHLDWRDVLVAGGLADESWPAELDRRLGPD
ncbi:MAG: hypothetical protein ACXW15_04270 [Acidimicrobiia bacterium]